MIANEIWGVCVAIADQDRRLRMHNVSFDRVVAFGLTWYAVSLGGLTFEAA
jgi:hypothetical protein